MRLSDFFLPMLKETPADAQIMSHRLMLRSGMVRQAASGIYTWLPLGLRVLKKIESVIHQEQARAGGQEILMPTLQSAELWQESGRYDDYGPEMLRINDRHQRALLYGPTNEEQVTDVFRRSVTSYRSLPQIWYQIQWKFRDEIRPRFGVMRGREFLMKDAYSFATCYDDALDCYHRMFVAYLRTFARMGLKAIPMRADTGPIGGDLSHEFLILADTGESEVYFDRQFLDLPVPSVDHDYKNPSASQQIVNSYTSLYAVTDDRFVQSDFMAQVQHEHQIVGRGIEVGHIFYFSDKYSAPMQAVMNTDKGHNVPVLMGSYGIGVSRLVGALIESSHDEQGIIWHPAIAPFDVAIINLKQNDPLTDDASQRLLEACERAGLECLYHDTSDSTGTKFAQMDLIGIPWKVVVGMRSAKRGYVELQVRRDGIGGVNQEMTIEEVINFIQMAKAHHVC